MRMRKKKNLLPRMEACSSLLVFLLLGYLVYALINAEAF